MTALTTSSRFPGAHGAAWLGLMVLGFWAIYGPAGPRPFLAVNGLSLICP